MKAWFACTDDGRVGASTTIEEFAIGMTEIDVDDGFDFSHQGDYLLQDGELVYDGAQTKAEQEAERAAQEAAEQAQAIQEASKAFFVDGGKERMEADIEDAKASGGADPALASFVTLSLPMVAPTAKDSALAPVMKYAPEYVPEGHAYKKGEVFAYDGAYYRCSQDFTSQAQWVPGSVESLCYRIEIAPDGVIVWAQPHGEYDAPDKGDKRHYPGADGPVYESLIDANAYSPDAYPQGWKLAEG